MLSSLLSNRLLLGGLGLFLLFAAFCLYHLTQMETETPQMRESPEKIVKPLVENNSETTEIPEVTETPPQPEELPQDEHFHEGEHNAPIQAKTEPPPEVELSPIQIPEGITDPEVLAAWQRLEYISLNIWEWGGVPSQRATELINQLMPPPEGFSGPTAHRDVEETIDLLGELAWSGDPRAAEVLATYLCEGSIGGRGPKNALVEMGLPAVPYLVPYMLDMTRDPLLRSRAIEVLGRIAQNHREELGGIVEHILIPRLEAILSEEEPDYHEE